MLVPYNADATQVLLSSGGIGQPQLVGAEYAFTVFTTVAIPEDERAPLSFAEVLVSPSASNGFASGRISGSICMANTTAVAGARVEVVALGGGAPTYGALNGTIHYAVTNGTGYGLGSTGYSVDYGYGYGYGSSSGPTTITVELLVIGCLDAADFPGMPANPAAAFDVQVLLGANALQTFPSAPVTVTLYDPTFVAPTTNVVEPGGPAPNMTVDVGTPTNSGDFTGITFTLVDNDGDTIPFEPLPAGTTIGPFDFPAGGNGETGATFSITTQAPLAAGTQISFTFDAPDSLDAMAPPFGMDPVVLGTTLGGRAPALFFQILVSQPGLGFVDATALIDIEVTLTVEDAYFTTGGTTPGYFALSAFTADGTLKALQPGLLGLTQEGTTHLLTFRIPAFSSYAGYGRAAVASAGGFGAGGGGTVVAPPVVTPDPVTPVTPDPVTPDPVTPVTPDPVVPETPEDRSVPESTPEEPRGGLSTGMLLGIVAVLVVAAGAAFLFLRRK